MQTDLAIVAALDDELKILRAGFQFDERVRYKTAKLLRGNIANKSIWLINSGLGAAAMTRCMQFFCKQQQPQLVLHLGYCGASDPSLQNGDLVLASEIINANTGEQLLVRQDLQARAEKLCQEWGLRFQKGSLLSVDKIIDEPHQKAFLGTKHQALAIDMESFALAQACAARKIPYLVLRSVFDPLEMQMPEIACCLDEAGNIKPFALVCELIRQPKKIIQLPRLMQYALKAREAISTFAKGWISL